MRVAVDDAGHNELVIRSITRALGSLSVLPPRIFPLRIRTSVLVRVRGYVRKSRFGLCFRTRVAILRDRMG